MKKRKAKKERFKVNIGAKLLIFLVIHLILLGVLFPYLISVDNTFMVVLGFALMFLNIYLIFIKDFGGIIKWLNEV